MTRLITIITTTLLSFVSANVSKQELYQIALEQISTQEAHRELATEECLAGQDFINESGIHKAFFWWGVEDEMVDLDAQYEIDSMDSDFCSDLGGRVVSLDFEFRDCGVALVTFHNVQACLHTACDEETTYADDPVTLSFGDSEKTVTCQMTRTFSGGEANSSPVKSKMTNAVLALAIASLFNFLL